MKLLLLLSWNNSPKLIISFLIFVFVLIGYIVYYKKNFITKGQNKNTYAIKKMLSGYIFQISGSVFCAIAIRLIISLHFPSIMEDQFYGTVLSKAISYSLIFLMFNFLFSLLGIPTIKLSDFTSLLSNFIIAKSNIKWLNRFTIKTVLYKEVSKKSPGVLKELEFCVLNTKQYIEDDKLYIIYYQYTQRKKCFLILPLPFTKRVSNLFVKNIIISQNGEYVELKKELKCSKYEEYNNQLRDHHNCKNKKQRTTNNFATG